MCAIFFRITTKYMRMFENKQTWTGLKYRWAAGQNKRCRIFNGLVDQTLTTPRSIRLRAVSMIVSSVGLGTQPSTTRAWLGSTFLILPVSPATCLTVGSNIAANLTRISGNLRVGTFLASAPSLLLRTGRSRSF